MNLNRMGEINISDMTLQPNPQSPDGSFLLFDLSEFDVLAQAHFYDAVSAAKIYVFVTYFIRVECAMASGHVVLMEGRCTEDEYQQLERLYNEAQFF